jgi:hypothetical protein
MDPRGYPGIPNPGAIGAWVFLLPMFPVNYEIYSQSYTLVFNAYLSDGWLRPEAMAKPDRSSDNLFRGMRDGNKTYF